jgi:DNA-binding response OmpR family regulator
MNDLPRRSILLVEDEPLLAMDVEAILRGVGFDVAGPATTTAEAFRLILADTPDAALLDLNLGTEMVFPLLDHLDEKKIPFLILSGHSQQMVPPRHRRRPFLQKPCDPAVLLRAVRQVLEPVPGQDIRQRA